MNAIAPLRHFLDSVRTRILSGTVLAGRTSVELEARREVVERVLVDWTQGDHTDYDPSSLSATSFPVKKEADEALEKGYPESYVRFIGERFEIPLQHDFSLDDRDGVVVLREEIRAPRIWLIGLLLMTISFAVTFLFLYATMTFDLEMRSLSIWILLGGNGLILGTGIATVPSESGFLIPSDVFEKNPHEKFWISTNLFLLLLWSAFISLASIAFGLPAFLVVVSFVLSVLAGIIALDFDVLWREDVWRSLPSPTVEYIHFVIILSMPAILYRGLGVMLRSGYSGPGMSSILQGILAFGMGLGMPEFVLNRFSSTIRETPAYQAFRRGERFVTDSKVRIAAILVALTFTYAFAWLSIEVGNDLYGIFQMSTAEFEFPTFEYFFEYDALQRDTVVTTTRWIAALGLLGIIIPVGILASGLIYQLIAATIGLLNLFVSSRPLESPVKFDANVSLRMVESKDLFALSQSLPPFNFIFVSEGLLREMDDRAIQALLAHEEGHIHHRDAVVSLLVPYLSTAMLLGRTILFASLNFRSREFRADAFAVKKVGAENVIHLLESWDRPAINRVEPPRQRWVFSFLGAYVPTAVKTYIAMFFGQFTLSKAHPTLSERKQAIQDSFRMRS